jgi:hypothetical protein
VSSGVVDVGIRRGTTGLVITSLNVVLDTDDSIAFGEYSAAKAATAAAAGS